MKTGTTRCMARLGMTLAAILLACGTSFAATFNLRADTLELTMPDSTVVKMWGFAEGAGPVTVPGPTLEVPPGDSTLEINLTNNLPVPVSVVIPGQAALLSPVKFTDPDGRERVYSFTATAAAGGGTATYTWTGLAPGTYMYFSGTHPAVQVQMGLYGAMKKDASAGVAYSGAVDASYQNEVLVFYSEIDPALHEAVDNGTYGTPAYPSTIDYRPKYFLVNGEPYTGGRPPIPAGNINERTLIRFLNAGLDTHVPLLQGPYMDIVAEDGKPYPFAKKQYSALLPAGKTADAIITPDTAGIYPLYDRRLYLTNNNATGGGLLVHLAVAAQPGAPLALNDSYTLSEDGSISVAASGVLGNDTGTGLSAALVTDVSNGSLSLLADGSFSYTPNADFNGTDFFRYQATDGTLQSNTATVTLTVTAVNDTPVAVDDNAQTTAGLPVVIAPLANDTDPDADALSVVALSQGANGGTVALNADNTVTYTPPVGYASDMFTYIASDGTADSNQATVYVTIVNPVNAPPVANNDTMQTTRNTPVVINLIANDTDPDGTIDPASIVITAPPTRDGTVVVNGDGTVTFTPRKNFRGTDVFYYTVKDNAGAVSNEARVQVNVRR